MFTPRQAAEHFVNISWHPLVPELKYNTDTFAHTGSRGSSMFLATSLKTKNYDSLKKMKLIREKLGELLILGNYLPPISD